MDKRSPATGGSITRGTRGTTRSQGGTGRAADVAERDQVEKLLPQNVEAEAGVLGSILIDAGAMVAVADFVRPEDFYHEAHRTIFTAMCDLFVDDTLVGEGGSTDYVTL